jgi:hypothetical protein
MAERVVPIEGRTGIPLAIAPRYDLPKVLKSRPGEQDWHHALPRRRFKGLSSLSAAALMGARVEYADYDEHRTYHYYFDEYFDRQWQVPEERLKRFGMGVMLGAGYIPEMAIRSRRAGPEYVPLTIRQREFMWERGIVRVENQKALFDFVRSVVLEQPLDIESIAVQEFVFSDDEQLRMRRGMELLTAAADLAAEPVHSEYVAALQRQCLPPGSATSLRDHFLQAPTLLGTEKRQRHARTDLQRRIADELGVTLPYAA